MTALVRFYRLDLTWLLLDQIRDVTIASAIARGESLPLLGPRIGWTDAYLGPLYYYLLALPFLLTGAPIAGAVFVAASNVLAVYLLYRFARRFWGAPTALAAAALFGVFPLAVWSSRLVWHAGLLPLFTVLFMRFLFAVAVDGRSKAATPMLGLLAVLTQLHLSTIAFVPMALLALVVGRRRLKWRHVVSGAGLGVLLYAPYLAHEAAHGFENVRGLAAGAAADAKATPASVGAVLLNVLCLYQPALTGFFPGEPSAAALPLASRLLYAIEAILLGAGGLIAIGRLVLRWRVGTAPGPAGWADAFLLLWLVSPLLVLGTRGTPMWWYYFDLLYPSQFILAGIALSALAALGPRVRLGRRALPSVATALTAALVLSQVAMVMTFQREAGRRGQLVVDARRFPINGVTSPFGQLASLPLGYRSSLIETLLGEFGIGAEGFSRRVHGAVLGLPDDSDYLVRYFEGRGRRRPAGGGDTHYLVARDEGPASLPDGLRSARVGPYRVVEYRPMIDYASWRYGTAPARDPCGVTTRWVPLESTWPRLEADVPDADELVLKGTLVVPARAEPRIIVVSVTAWAPPTSIELCLDGVRTRQLSQTLRQDPLMVQRSSRWLMGVGWSAEARFALGKSIWPGEHSIEVRLTGGGRTISIDVFDKGQSG